MLPREEGHEIVPPARLGMGARAHAEKRGKRHDAGLLAPERRTVQLHLRQLRPAEVTARLPPKHIAAHCPAAMRLAQLRYLSSRSLPGTSANERRAEPVPPRIFSGGTTSRN